VFESASRVPDPTPARHARVTREQCRALMLCVGALACSPAPHTESPQLARTPTALTTTSPGTSLATPDLNPGTSRAPRFVGRVQRITEVGARYAWSGSGFQLRFFGQGAVAHFNDPGNWHTLLVDGQLQPPLQTHAGQTRYVLAQDLPLGEHLVEVYRRSEALFGATELLGLEIPGGHLLPPPAAFSRQIEIVGDSISCGYGNEGTSPECKFSPATENHYLSYGALLARALDAELSTVAWSGRGVVKNYNGEAGPFMPALYDRTLPESDSRWIATTTADAVIVNLGTNDFSTEPDPSLDDFVPAYIALLEAIRRAHPAAFILCTVGPMLPAEDLARASQGIGRAVLERVRRGDSRVAQHTLLTGNLEPGCDGHPGLATHQRMSAELLQVLRKHLLLSAHSQN
jgi:lysophospholipase L1-like esterase